jgi:hypothetical protein
MKALFLHIMLWMYFTLTAFAQNDVVYTTTGRFECSTDELTTQGVYYRLPGETMRQFYHKNNIDSIVLSNGRQVVFENRMALRPVHSVLDFERVQVTSTPSDVVGLTKIGQLEAFAGAVGLQTTVGSNASRRLTRLKQLVAMQGGQVLLITGQDVVFGDDNVYYSASRFMTADMYVRKLPAKAEFEALIGTTRVFYPYRKMRFNPHTINDPYDSNFKDKIRVDTIVEENNFVYVYATEGFGGVPTKFLLIGLDDEKFVLYNRKWRTLDNLIFRVNKTGTAIQSN